MKKKLEVIEIDGLELKPNHNYILAYDERCVAPEEIKGLVESLDKQWGVKILVIRSASSPADAFKFFQVPKPAPIIYPSSPIILPIAPAPYAPFPPNPVIWC